MNKAAEQEALSKAIVKAIAFYDIFDYPLTPWELKREVGGNVSLQAIRQCLVADERLREKWGFYFLAGRDELVDIRQKRHNYGRRKLKIARRYAQVFGLSPWVRAVFLANSFGSYNLRDSGDIDLFIISAPGRLWLSRLYCTGLAELLGARPSPGDKKDRLCLSFYISASRLNMSSLDLDGKRLYYEKYRQNFILLYNRKESSQEFMAANQPAAELTQAAVDAPADIFEKLARTWQLSIMPRAMREAAWEAEGVVIDDYVLKFHQHDRRREIIARYEETINKIG